VINSWHRYFFIQR